MQQQMMISYGASGGGGTAIAWDPANNSTGITLSESNLLATRNSNSAWRSSAGTPARSSGKHFASVQRVGDPEWGIIIGVSPARPSDGGFVGDSSNNWGLQCGGGPNANLLNSGVAVGTAINTVADSAIVRIAIDFDAGKGWIGNPTQWHGGGDPATNTTPSFTFTPNTSMVVCASIFSSTAACRMVTASIPSGFSQW